MQARAELRGATTVTYMLVDTLPAPEAVVWSRAGTFDPPRVFLLARTPGGMVEVTDDGAMLYRETRVVVALGQEPRLEWPQEPR